MIIFILSLVIISLILYFAIWAEDDGAIVFAIFCTIGFIIEIILLLTVNVNGRFEYVRLQSEREVLVYRLQNETEDSIITQNPQLYEEIVEFNTQIRSNIVSQNNLWVNWFVYDEIGNIELIELN